MIKKILLNLLIKWYVNKYQDVHSLSTQKEIQYYLMANSSDIEEILRMEISKRMTRYFSAGNEMERNIIKGEVLALKMLKDKHLLAVRLNTDNETKNSNDLKERYWKQFIIK